MIKKRGKEWTVVHCHGKDKGEAIGTHNTKAEAIAQHQAIEISKRKRHSMMGK